jgi:hypothetical protein
LHGSKQVIPKIGSVDKPTVPEVVCIEDERSYMIYKYLADGPKLATQVSEGGIDNEESLQALSSWIGAF